MHTYEMKVLVAAISAALIVLAVASRLASAGIDSYPANTAFRDDLTRATIQERAKLNEFVNSYIKLANEQDDQERADKFLLASMLVSSISSIYENKMLRPTEEIELNTFVTKHSLEYLLRSRLAANAEIDGRFERLIKLGSELKGTQGEVILRDAKDIFATLNRNNNLIATAINSHRFDDSKTVVKGK